MSRNEPGGDSSVARFSVETPEQVQLQLEVAGVGMRSMAFLIDYGVVFITMITLLLAAQFATQQNIVDWFDGPKHIVLPLMILGAFLLFWGYFLLFEWLWNGQTPGKHLMHLRVVKDGGYPISFFDSVVRNLLRVVDCYLPPFFFAVGIVCIFVHPRHKRLGDLAARTVVVVERPLQFDVRRAGQSAQAASFRPLIESLDLAVEELDLVDSYLKRRSELEPASAAALRADIVDYLRTKLNSQANGADLAGDAQDAFLEELVAHYTVSRRA